MHPQLAYLGHTVDRPVQSIHSFFPVWLDGHLIASSNTVCDREAGQSGSEVQK